MTASSHPRRGGSTGTRAGRWVGWGTLVLALGLGPTRLLAQEPGHSRPELLESLESIGTAEQVGEWLTYYYLHPRRDLAASALRQMSQEGYLADPSVNSSMAAFFGRLMAADPTLVAELVEVARQGSEDQQFAVANALWQAGTKEAQAALVSMSELGSDRLVRYVAELRADPRHPDYLHDAVDSPAILDACWASFFATGDPAYVHRIIEVLPWAEIRGDVAKLLIGSAARWSLASNAIQHPRVLEICEARLASGPDTALEEIVAAAKERARGTAAVP
jgi:hypothetical protein